MRATQLLMEEHEIILRGLRVLEVLAAKAARGDPVPPQAVDQMIGFLTGFADTHHHHKEEEILFPALEDAGLPSDGGPVGVMLQEHVQGRALIAALRQAAPRVNGTGPERTPLGHLRAVLDELVDAGVLHRRRRDGIEYPIWSTVHGMAVLAGQGPLRDVPDATRRHLEDLTLTFIGGALS